MSATIGPGSGILTSAANVIVPTEDTLWRSGARGNQLTVHHADCPRLRTAKRKWPWHWAKGKPLWEVFDAPWNFPCRWCTSKIESGRPPSSKSTSTQGSA